jgi:hypothetical protein
MWWNRGRSSGLRAAELLTAEIAEDGRRDAEKSGIFFVIFAAFVLGERNSVLIRCRGPWFPPFGCAQGRLSHAKGAREMGNPT